MRINFDFTDLEIFLAVHDTGSFHLASETLGLSQSSVTRRVQKLETELDARLFDRTTREVRPTLSGKRFRARAEAILNETKEAARAIRDESAAHAHQLSRSLTIAVVPTVISRLVVPAIRRLCELHPTARFRIVDCSANNVAEAVVQGEADIGICSVPAFEPATTFEFLFEDPLIVALHSTHPLTQNKDLLWSDLAGENLILPSRGTGNRMLIDDALAGAGIPLTWRLEVRRTATALAFVSGGMGLAPMPSLETRHDRYSSVVTRPLKSPTVTRPIGFLRRAGHKDGSLCQQFSETICNIIDE